MGPHSMGGSQGKQEQIQTVLNDFSATSGMPINEVMGLWKDWMKNNPSGSMNKKNFTEYMGRGFPEFSQQDLLKISEHVFRVFDTSGDGKIDFVEFLVVYNIMTWTEPRVMLCKIFDIFDVDKDDMITKKEMERVINDLSALFRNQSKEDSNDCVVKSFAEMDENQDEKVTREEFIEAILGNKSCSQGLSTAVLELFMD